MLFKKIAGPVRIDSGANGAEKVYQLKARPGGSMAKTVHYFIKVYQSTGANTMIGLDVTHGPDGSLFTLLKANTVAWTAVGTTPVVIEGSITTEVVGEYILPIIKIKDSGAAAAQFALVEVFETRKPW